MSPQSQHALTVLIMSGLPFSYKSQISQRLFTSSAHTTTPNTRRFASGVVTLYHVYAAVTR